MDSRIKSMDMLRAIAIFLVILAHTVLSFGAPISLAPLQLGGTGVDLFFVLSGWLLGSQLFKEANKIGSINVKRFWIRRWMRTLPAYYAILCFSVIQRMMTKPEAVFPWDYFVFIQNYDYPLHFFSISWSLCVEEQFYLLIAPLLALLTIRSKRDTTIILLLILATPYVFRYNGWYNDVNETHVRIDGCILGVVLSNICYCYTKLWKKIVSFALPAALLSLLIYLFFLWARFHSQLGVGDPDKLLLSIIFGTWVVLANTDKKWAAWLYFPGANHIATRSYALYLIHPEVLALLRRFTNGLPFIIYLALAFGVSLVLSEFLYRAVEKPIMDFRENFNFSKSNNSTAIKLSYL